MIFHESSSNTSTSSGKKQVLGFFFRIRDYSRERDEVKREKLINFIHFVSQHNFQSDITFSQFSFIVLDWV